MPRIGRELHLAALLQIVDDLWPTLEIDFAAVVGSGPDHGIEISARIGDGVRATGFAALTRAGHPDRAGGRRRGPANLS